MINQRTKKLQSRNSSEQKEKDAKEKQQAAGA
jgi:hypothetical protein